MENQLTIMNFSHVYENETFYKLYPYHWIECSNMKGCNGYCDYSAIAALEKKLSVMKPEGIHFIDSGNYHYVSEIWMERIHTDFSLVVFDHHSDMRQPVFGDILSCGSWIMDALLHNKYLKKVILIGVSQEQEEAILDESTCLYLH